MVGLYGAKKDIIYAIYVFKEKLVSWCFSYLYYSRRTLLMYLKLLCLLRAVLLLSAGDRSCML